VTAVETHGFFALFVVETPAAVVTGDAVIKQLAERHLEATKGVEQSH